MKLPVILFLLLACAANVFGQQLINDQTRWVVRDGDTVIAELPSGNAGQTVIAGRDLRPPIFPGDMQAYLKAELAYPADAKKLGIEGTARLYCKIDRTGRVAEVLFLDKTFPSLDQEALRLVKQLPAWQPAIADGWEPVDYWETINVAFKL